jgi:hypothetical protein
MAKLAPRPLTSRRLQRTACWLCAVLAFGLLAPTAFSQQGTGLDQLSETLRKRTEARRSAAELAWKDGRDAYLAGPDRERREALAAFAPEIQGPILASLRRELQADRVDEARVDALVALLGETANTAGADRLAQHLLQLPPAARLRAIGFLGRNGGPRSVRALEASLQARDAELRDASLLALLKVGKPMDCQAWLAEVEVSRLSTDKRVEVLGELQQRPLPAEFSLPTSWYELREPQETEALFLYLQQHPDENVEGFVLEYILDRNRPLKLRLQGLAVAEHGARELKWRDAKRKLGALLRAKDGDPMAEEAAWALHRLDDKAGARFLLDAPEEQVKRNKNDWRAYLSLGEMQVRLSEFRDGFRTYEDAIRLAEVSRGRLQSSDWLFAARAAAGARKEREAGEWLARTRMSPSELAPYRDLPEFADLLDQEPFDRLFGTP